MQFPVEMMNLTHRVVPEKLLHLAFVATKFWWKSAKYVPWRSLEKKKKKNKQWKCILYIRFIYIPDSREVDPQEMEISECLFLSAKSPSRISSVVVLKV